MSLETTPPPVPLPKTAVKPVARVTARTTWDRRLLFVVVAALVAIGITASLWISVSAMFEKARLISSLSQINDIVSVARQSAATDHRIVDSTHGDLLDILNSLGQLTTTGESDGFKTLANPWNGKVTAQMRPGTTIRIETVVPSTACRRLVTMFTLPPVSLDLLNVDVKGSLQTWWPFFAKDRQLSTNENQIEAACANPARDIVALTFRLR